MEVGEAAAAVRLESRAQNPKSAREIYCGEEEEARAAMKRVRGSRVAVREIDLWHWRIERHALISEYIP